MTAVSSLLVAESGTSARKTDFCLYSELSGTTEYNTVQSVPLVEPFLSSGDRLLRYDAAWWLSFREVNTKVTNELKNAMQDESLGASERSAARDRLRDMAEGKFVP
jgi:hypothetical protein